MIGEKKKFGKVVVVEKVLNDGSKIMMTTGKDKFDAIEFIASENMDGVCGPEGCSIADHQKKVEEQEKQGKQK